MGVSSDLLNPVFFSAGHEVFCVRYSPDGQFIAASRGDGNIDVYSTGTGAYRHHQTLHLEL